MSNETRVIWKFDFPVYLKQFSVWAPEGSVPLRAQIHDGRPVVWMLVYPNNTQKSHDFAAVYTGENMYGGLPGSYFDTIQTADGLVYHCFINHSPPAGDQPF